MEEHPAVSSQNAAKRNQLWQSQFSQQQNTFTQPDRLRPQAVVKPVSEQQMERQQARQRQNEVERAASAMTAVGAALGVPVQEQVSTVQQGNSFLKNSGLSDRNAMKNLPAERAATKAAEKAAVAYGNDYNAGSTPDRAMQAYYDAENAYKRANTQYAEANAETERLLSEARNTLSQAGGMIDVEAFDAARKEDEAAAEKEGRLPSYERTIEVLRNTGALSSDSANYLVSSLQAAVADEKRKTAFDYLNERTRVLSNRVYDRNASWAAFAQSARQSADYAKKSKPVQSEDGIPGDNGIGDAYHFLANLIDGDSNEYEDREDLPGGTVRGMTYRADHLAQMTKSEREMFYYLYNSGRKAEAEMYLASLLPDLKYRSGENEAESVDYPVLRELYSFSYGLASGLRNTWYGLASIVADMDAPEATSEDYAQQVLLEKNHGSLAYYTSATAQNIGNMLPATAGYLVHPILGSSITFTNARGDGYIDAKRRGATHEEAWVYGTLVGASEAFLERLLGLGGGVVKGALPEKLIKSITPKINSTVGKLAAQFGVNLAGEVVEENLQNYLEPAFAMMAGIADEYDAPGLAEFAETTIVTAITTLFFGAIRAKTDIQQIQYDNQIREAGEKYAESNNPIEKQLGQQLIDMVDGLKTGEHVSPEAVLQSYVEATEKVAERSALKQTEQRAELVQENNPDSEVVKSHGTQLYLDKNAPLEVAEKAGEVLDGILSGEITSENITGKKADKLRLFEPYSAEIVSEALGVDIPKVTTAAQARAAVKNAVRAYEQRIKAVATQENNANNSVQQSADTSSVLNELAAQAQETASEAVAAAPETQSQTEAFSETPNAVSKQQTAQELPAEQSAAPVSEESSAALSPEQTAGIASVKAAGQMDYKTFKHRMKTDKEFRSRYTTRETSSLPAEARDTNAYELYNEQMRGFQAGQERLSREDFGRRYRDLNETKKNAIDDTEIDLAYQEYLEARQEVAPTETGEQTAEAEQDAEDRVGLVENAYSEAVPQEVREAVDALAKQFGLQISYLENRNGVNSFTFVCLDEETNSLVAVGGAINVIYEGQTVNRVLSIFHISAPEFFLTKSGKDLVTTNAEKAKNILEKARIQSPALQNILDSARIITQANSVSQERSQKNAIDASAL